MYDGPNSVTAQLAQDLKSTSGAKRTWGPSRVILPVSCIFVLGYTRTGDLTIITDACMHACMQQIIVYFRAPHMRKARVEEQEIRFLSHTFLNQTPFARVHYQTS